nr:DUF429 domain-containing protein [Devosia sp. WQ 349K1]
MVHCDWSLDSRKRWMVVAQRQGSLWRVEPPELVGEGSSLLSRLRKRLHQEGAILVGFDFPIGLPAAYAKLAGFSSFKQALATLGQGEWANWFNVAQSRNEIAIHRPFYPMRPGGTKKSHQHEALGVSDSKTLLRTCELATTDRQAACSLFWTLGGNQVGKGAISGWSEVVIPSLNQAGIWPFDGPLSQLESKFPVVLAETYPGDVYAQLGISRGGWSKRRQADRSKVGRVIATWLVEHPQVDASGLLAALEDGFGEDKTGEDRFDAFVGLLGMLSVVTGERAEAIGVDESILIHEGWILGHHR